MCDCHNISIESMSDALQYLTDLYADRNWVIYGESTEYDIVIIVEYEDKHNDCFAVLYDIDEVYSFIKDGGLGDV